MKRYLAFSCISVRDGLFYGKVIEYQANRRQGIVVWMEEFPTRGIALRRARAAAKARKEAA